MEVFKLIFWGFSEIVKKNCNFFWEFARLISRKHIKKSFYTIFPDDRSDIGEGRRQ